MSKAPLLDLLFRHIELRDPLAPDEKTLLQDAVDRRFTVRGGMDIVREGDTPDHCTVLLSGLATRYRLLPEGARQFTALHVPGDFIDLQSFPLKLMDHSLGALSDCELASIPHTALMEITQTRPHLTRVLWKLSLLDAAIHREWVVAIGGLPAVPHLAHLFCEMYLRLESIGLAKDYSFALPLTQEQLADTLGISPVHANRSLQSLRGDGIIQFDGKTGTILNWRKLVDLGQFDDKHLHLHDEKPGVA